MAFLIAQLSDTHIGGRVPASGEQLSAAIEEINAMTRPPDLVLLTGDLTDHGTPEEWREFCDRLGSLRVPWEAIPGNHDRGIEELAGHRAIAAGPLRLVLLDTSTDVFTAGDAEWLEHELARHPATPTVIAVHQPPFETGIWWMDCVGLQGREGFEVVVRRHPQVIKVLSGHVHRAIQTNWDGCSLWVCPSTSVAVAADLDPAHDPAETAEAPTFSLHAYTGEGFVSHLIPFGPPAARSPLRTDAAAFVEWARTVQPARTNLFR